MWETSMNQPALERVLDISIDSVVGNPHAVFRIPPGDQSSLKVELIRQSLAFHYDASSYFRDRCDAAGFRPDDFRSLEDVPRIPMISIRTFKDQRSHILLSVSLNEIDLEIQSTGTGGIPSVARRDVVTTTRACLALVGQYREFFGINRGTGLFLCPDPVDLPEMGLVKVFNLFAGLLDNAYYAVHDYDFDPAEAVSYLERWKDKHTRHIFGPPFLINRLLRYMEEKDIKLTLDPRSFVITLGGWKRFNNENIGRRMFDQKLHTLLGIQSRNIRDMYGMIESNMLAIECEHHRKHVPPWCHVTVRDVADASTEVAPGETGVIGLIDALSHAYPSYILSEDVGRVEPEESCPCGRSGQVVTFERRLQGAEIGCCAVSIERNMENLDASKNCPLS
jgi:long-chain-fatty-acid---luciferin-component ligase